MNLALLDFQQEYVAELLVKLSKAKKHVADRELEAVLLAAPTGSGKTIMMAATIEQVLFGADGFDPEPDAVFLWLSDQPELNEQSRARLLSATSMLREHQLVTVQPEFDQEQFDGGKVYFLNTQKLGKDKGLTSKSDSRTFTIWETVQNTAERLRDRFYVVIDEAHRGMGRITNADAEARTTIVQKFLLGNPGTPMKAVPLVIGVSATPKRFEDLLNKQQNDRHLYKVVVDVMKVRESGLLKDLLRVWVPDEEEEEQPTDWTLLRTAGARWAMLRAAWRTYCESQNMAVVEPVLVIQVEDGTASNLTKTPLATAILTLEEAVGTISSEELAHCFQEDKDVVAGVHKIRHLAPSKVSSDPTVKFVFFKMALTTGWDCPRAEVMMSFRRAVDATLIAQLVGRMVRTPLARRVEENELLNEVHLYLPHYDKDGLATVISKLETDADNVPATKVVLASKTVDLSVPEELLPVLEKLRTLPNYKLVGGIKKPDFNLLFRLGSLLAMDGLDLPARGEAIKTVVDTLTDQRDTLQANNAAFQAQMAGLGTVSLRPLQVDQLTYEVSEGALETVSVAAQNVEDLYAAAKRRLGPELANPYLNQHYDEDDPNHTKLELYFLVQRTDVWRALEAASRTKFTEMRSRNMGAIQGLESSKRQRYDELAMRSRQPEVVSFALPTIISLPKPAKFERYEKHLYVDDKGGFNADLGGWEVKILKSELPNCVTWLRNVPRKPWALAYPYIWEGKHLPGYPDFLIVRESAPGQYLVDILEPHTSSLSDAWAKALGLARFAEKHGGDFGRILLQQVDGSDVRELNFQDINTREQALQLTGSDGLAALYNMHAVARNL